MLTIKFAISLTLIHLNQIKKIAAVINRKNLKFLLHFQLQK